MQIFFLKILGGAALGALAVNSSAAPLPELNIDPIEISVSGLSAGGFMAVQMHVAYSATFKRGAGVVAGGPYNCAEGSLINATGRCMAHTSSIPVIDLAHTTGQWAQNGLIDPLANLSGSKVYLYSGTADNTVKPAVMRDLQTFYQSFIPISNIAIHNTIASGHAMITDDYGGACDISASPYINDCDFDLAGEMLKHLYGPLNPRSNAALSGNFIEFNQTPFVAGHGMASTGWIYVPQACAEGVKCKLHVVLHGCRQNTATINHQFVRNTGYNRWADTNQMVVLYPQTSMAAINGCWDWWGYDRADYAKKSGPQMAAIKAMVNQLSSGTGSATLPAPTGVATSAATANSMVVTWLNVAEAMGYNVYRNAARANTSIVASTTYTDMRLAPGTTYAWTVRAVDSNGLESASSASASGTTSCTPSTGTCTRTSNFAHVLAGRAYVHLGLARAHGSNQNMGLWSIFVMATLKQTSPNYYVMGVCP